MALGRYRRCSEGKDGSFMESFKHFLYVLRCADETYYTGYTTDVERRLEAHRSGRGAKYTRCRGPLELVAVARFYTKERAMSAEYRFKQLTRAEKERLIAEGACVSFEQVLERALPGFREEPIGEAVARAFVHCQDAEYADFMASLVPGADRSRFIGVRAPDLRKLSRALLRRADFHDFMRAVPHRFFEEDQLHAYAIALVKGYDERLGAYEAFLPFVDNWATCDALAVRPLLEQPERALSKAREWMASDRAYVVRFGIRVLMDGFLDDRFDPVFLEEVSCTAVRAEGGLAPQAPAPGYYVNMMRAWFFAEALAHQPEEVLPWLEGCASLGALDEWTRRKAVQKACESRKIAAALKTRLRKGDGRHT